MVQLLTLATIVWMQGPRSWTFLVDLLMTRESLSVAASSSPLLVETIAFIKTRLDLYFLLYHLFNVITLYVCVATKCIILKVLWVPTVSANLVISSSFPSFTKQNASIPLLLEYFVRMLSAFLSSFYKSRIGTWVLIVETPLRTVSCLSLRATWVNVPIVLLKHPLLDWVGVRARSLVEVETVVMYTCDSVVGIGIISHTLQTHGRLLQVLLQLLSSRVRVGLEAYWFWFSISFSMRCCQALCSPE